MQYLVFGQKDAINQVIIYDFKDGKFDNANLNLKQKIPTILKIKNINPLFFTVRIEAQDKYISYENIEHTELQKVSGDISPVLNPTLKSIEAINENILINNFFSNKENEKVVQDSNQKKYEDLRLELEIIKQKYQKESLKLELIDKKDSAKVDSLQNIIDSLNNKRLEKQIQINRLIANSKTKKILEKEVFNNLNDLNKYYRMVISNAREIIKLNQNFNNYIDKINRPDLDHQTYLKLKKDSRVDSDSIETSFLLNKKNLKYAYGVVKVFKNNYQNFLDEFNNVQNRNFIHQLKNLDKEKEILSTLITSEYDRMNKAILEVDKLVQAINLSKKLNQLEIIDRELSNENTYTISSVPIQGIEDFIEFSIAIEGKNRLADSYLTEKNKNFKYFEYLKGGIRFDFSIGTVFDFGAKDKLYEIYNNKPKEISKNKFYPTLAGLFHASFRENGNFAGGISLGASLDVAKFSIESVFIGPSLLIGKRDKVILTIGPSFRKVSDLKSIYNENTLVDTNTTQKDLTTENFKVGFFVGLSYNLTSKQKGLIKISQ